MTSGAEPNRISVLEARIANLEGDLRDHHERLLALEKRLDHDDEILAKLRAIAGQRGDLDSAAAK